jgi:hypothetical protein
VAFGANARIRHEDGDASDIAAPADRTRTQRQNSPTVHGSDFIDPGALGESCVE